MLKQKRWSSITMRRDGPGSSCELSVGCPFGRTEETGVTNLQHSPEGPNEHPQAYLSDAVAARGTGLSVIEGRLSQALAARPMGCRPRSWRVGWSSSTAGETGLALHIGCHPRSTCGATSNNPGLPRHANLAWTAPCRPNRRGRADRSHGPEAGSAVDAATDERYQVSDAEMEALAI